MGNRLYVSLWYEAGIVERRIAMGILDFLKANLGKFVDEFHTRAEYLRIDDLGGQLKNVLKEIGEIKDGVVVGIVPAQIYKEVWGDAFLLSKGKMQSSKEELESLVVSAGICAMYRSLAYSIMKSNHTSRVILVHVHPIFFNSGYFSISDDDEEDVDRSRLLKLWTGKDGILSRVITMAKNQIAPFQEVHIGETWDKGIPGFLVDVGPKAIMVG